jgi:L-amino acid N-acyltransferase YncA
MRFAYQPRGFDRAAVSARLLRRRVCRMIIRRAMPQDAAAMADILNQIIAIGGTTAYQHPLSVQAITLHKISGPDVIATVVAVQDGQIVGWQSIEHWQGDAHIGTFVRVSIQAKGIGTALFAQTCEILRQAGVRSIVASIRADNVPGLRYYARLGFVDFATDPDFALETGQVVGRVHRRYDVV